MKSLTLIEVDVPAFSDPSPDEEQTWRFAVDVPYLPKEFEAIPSIKAVTFSPVTISLGSNLGQRGTLTVTLSDHRHIMNGESFDSGTFWGKWRARYGLRLRGRAVRWYTGLLGQSLAEMEVRHFIIESTEGPKPDGTYQIIAKDVLKLADNDRAQAPLLSNGFLVSAIDADDTAATLSPSGIGNSEYPASGYVAIAGKEICAFTRSGDALTLTRAQLGTTAEEHDDQDRVQLVLRYDAEDPADIIYDLLVNYGGIDPDHISLTSWQNETGAFLQRVYTATIPEPTGVNKLVSELIEQAALAIWWDDLEQRIRLQVLRPISSTAAVWSEKNTLANSLQVKEQPTTRVSQVWTYFGMRNPLRPVDEADNYRSTAITLDETAETDYGGAAIKKIFSRWIPAFGRSVATKLNQLILGRFVDPPRRFNFDVWRYSEDDANPLLGTGYQLTSWIEQDETGAAAMTPIQITRLNPMPDRFQIEAEELLFDTSNQDVSDRVIIIDSNVNNFDLREVHDTLFPTVTGTESPAVTLTCIVEEGVIVGSNSVNLPAFDVGDWPAGLSVTLQVNGRIQGRGGVGADGSDFLGFGTYIGGYGGPALLTTFPISLDYTDGEIYGGAGGGGGGKSGAGGGGAGKEPGLGGTTFPSEGDPVPGNPGTTEAGGAGVSDGGDGGDPGEYGYPGAASKFGQAPVGGYPGAAILGYDQVTITGSPEGDLAGPVYDHIRSVSATPGDGSSMAVILPPGKQTGDLLLMFISNYRGDVEDESDDISLSTPSGWTQLYHTTGPGYMRRASCYYRVATGSEGSSVTVNANRSCSWGTVCYAVRDYTGTPEAGTSATGTSTAPNPPSLSPTWGSDEILVFASAHHIVTDLESDNEPPDLPSGYQGNLGTLFIATGHRRVTTGTENPGTFLFAASDSWVAQTVAVRTA